MFDSLSVAALLIGLAMLFFAIFILPRLSAGDYSSNARKRRREQRKLARQQMRDSRPLVAAPLRRRYG